MITNGMVSVEDGKKAIEEYAPARKVRVDLFFSVDEGADEKAVLHDAFALADSQVKSALGQKAAAKGSVDTAQAAVVGEAAADKPKPGRRKAAAAAEALPPVDDFPIEGAAPTAKPTTDETILDDSVLGVEPAAPKVDISDKALYDFVVATNAKLKKPKEITEIITKFCPNDGVPPSLKRVPEAKRVEFLEAVKAFAAAQK